MARKLNREKNITKSMILHSASKLFLERGYANTKIADIAHDAGITYNEVFRICTDKETILCELVGLVLECQFKETERILKNVTNDKLLMYAFETVLQLHMAESIEHIREMYSVSYSLPHSSKIIYRTITSKLEEVFKSSLPHLETKDFYELEIASAGIMRGFITVPCDIYFTMNRKIKRFLETTFKIYNVSDEKILEVIEFVNQFDFTKIAKDVINSLFDYLQTNT